MAVTEQRILPAEYLEALGKTYAERLTSEVGQPVVTTAETQQPGETAAQFAQRQQAAQKYGIAKAGMAELAPQVAKQDQYQEMAYDQAIDATKGLGAFQPYLTAAGTAATGATGLTGPMTEAQRTAYMSPYQTAVIQTTLDEFDEQAKRQKAIQDAATLGVPGAFGGGREGVLQAQYQSLSDRNRAAIFAGLQQEGFGQAQKARQQDYLNQIGLANLQSGLGGQAQNLYRGQISGLGTLGGIKQAQTQAEYDAARQGAQMAAQERFNRLGQLGSGVMGLMGASPARTNIGEAPPSVSPLAQALGIGATAAGIYGAIK